MGVARFRDNADGSIVEAIQDTAENVFDIFEWVPRHRLRLTDMCGSPAMYLTTTGGGCERVFLNQWIIRRSEHDWGVVGATYFAERFAVLGVS